MAVLEEYRRKRRFEKTPEPAGEKEARAPSRRFVVQKHDARRLHYDFRLEVGGVLKSWAVPKGPSLNPVDKRLAMQTEDHPLEYADFEGVIPEGQYGAGPVMVWDQGTFEAEGSLSASQQLERGDLKFTLYGRKLRGSFVLVKLRQPQKDRGKPWLLIKHKDARVDPNWNIDDHDGSVLTGRTLKEIEEGLPASGAAAELTQAVNPGELEGASPMAMPKQLEPMLATLVDTPFSDPEWLFEIKWDGIRALAWVEDGRVELRARSGRVITQQYPELAELPQRVRARRALLDGEIVALDENGRSNFERLQARMNVSRPSPFDQRQAPVTYYLFDALHCEGYDLRQVPLLDRKRLLKSLIDWGGPLRYADHQMEQGRELFELASQQGLEGIIGKHAHSPYTSTRSPYWVKFKVVQELDAVVGGWTEPRGSREYFGALLLGLYDGAGLKDGAAGDADPAGEAGATGGATGTALRYIGSVGTGFTEKTQRTAFERLQGVKIERCPFDVVPDTKEKACWVEPALVARVKYANWTQERRLRAPVFVGLRDDREPRDCVFEKAVASPEPSGLWASPAAPSAPQSRQTFAQPLHTSEGAGPPHIVKAPALVGRVLSRKAEIEQELLQGRAENITVEIEGKPLRLSHLNKVYFPGSGYTKRDLLAYYYRMADLVLPFLQGRPLVLRRYPNGITGTPFFQKDAGETIPEWMETVDIYSKEKHREVPYFVADDRASLLYLTNLGCIDHNPWSSQRDDLAHPDYLFFDLDPTEGTAYSTVVEVAQAVFKKLHALELTVYIKTSGATGLHLYVPVERGYTYEQVRAFAEIIARLVAREHAQKVTQQRAVEKRPPGSVLIDVSQNAEGRPLAAVYTVRAFPHAPVSAPISPGELKRSLRPEKLNLKTTPVRVEKRGDLWADFWKKRQRLEEALERLHLEDGG
jgi:bifunctional non-homologous end joining protein LigD